MSELAERLVEAAWVHVATVAVPGEDHWNVLVEIDEAVRGAVAAVLRELRRSQTGDYDAKIPAPVIRASLGALADEVDKPVPGP